MRFKYSLWVISFPVRKSLLHVLTEETSVRKIKVYVKIYEAAIKQSQQSLSNFELWVNVACTAYTNLIDVDGDKILKKKTIAQNN